MAQLEIACFNLQSALIAQQNGADRVELCSGIEAGGTTPDFEMVESARRHLVKITGVGNPARQAGRPTPPGYG